MPRYVERHRGFPAVQPRPPNRAWRHRECACDLEPPYNLAAPDSEKVGEPKGYSYVEKRLLVFLPIAFAVLYISAMIDSAQEG